MHSLFAEIQWFAFEHWYNPIILDCLSHGAYVVKVLFHMT